MKTAILLTLALLALAPAQAQILRPEAVNGAVLGGIAGAVIGHNSGDLRHNGWKGAAIGAGAGLLLGEMIGSARTTALPMARSGGYVYRDRPEIHVGVGYGHGPRYRNYGYGPGLIHRSRGHGSYGRAAFGGGYAVHRSVPAYGYYPGYGRDYPYYDGFGTYGTYAWPHRAASAGLLWGGLAGGIIGHNSGDFRHSAWRGSAWGAGVGWLLGSVIDARRQVSAYAGAPVVVSPAPVVQSPPPATSAQPQQVTIINNYYNSPSPMSTANGLFGR